MDKLYASLKELTGDRRVKLDEVLKLYLLNRDIEDIEQWIAEREVVAGSHELGQDFEHVTVSWILVNVMVEFLQYCRWLNFAYVLVECFAMLPLVELLWFGDDVVSDAVVKYITEERNYLQWLVFTDVWLSNYDYYYYSYHHYMYHYCY